MRVSTHRKRPGDIRDYEPIQPGRGRSGSFTERAKKFLGPIAVAVIAFASKAKAILLLLPKIKVLSTSATMLVSIAAYSLIWGWSFALGFVLLLLVHEMGHVIQLRREGIEASAPMFIPFMGAVVAAKSMGDDAGAEARVGLAGPVLGTLGCLVPLGIWLATGEEFWQALAFVGFFLNLFNLLPVLPLDGGRAMAALSPWVWTVGFARPRRTYLRLPEPDHDPDPASGRHGDLSALQGAEHARRRVRSTTSREAPGSASRSSTWASQRSWRSECPRRSSSATSATSE